MDAKKTFQDLSRDGRSLMNENRKMTKENYQQFELAELARNKSRIATRFKSCHDIIKTKKSAGKALQLGKAVSR